MGLRRDWDERIRAWSAVWELPGLEQRVRVSVSSRLRSSLGRCAPERGVVRIAKAVAEGPSELLDEVLCHEVAHVAVFELHGRMPRPHGKEWAALLRAVGFEPRARIAGRGLGTPSTGKQTFPSLVYEHRCLVCGTRRLAKRPVRRWRCARCSQVGLTGRLEIRSFPLTLARGQE